MMQDITVLLRDSHDRRSVADVATTLGSLLLGLSVLLLRRRSRANLGSWWWCGTSFGRWSRLLWSRPGFRDGALWWRGGSSFGHGSRLLWCGPGFRDGTLRGRGSYLGGRTLRQRR